jgi:hypothetical protein
VSSLLTYHALQLPDHWSPPDPKPSTPAAHGPKYRTQRDHGKFRVKPEESHGHLRDVSGVSALDAAGEGAPDGRGLGPEQGEVLELAQRSSTYYWHTI